jgi:hypothetical protein
MKRVSLPLVVIVLSAAIASAQTPQTHPEGHPPDFGMQKWGGIGADFSMRVQSYVALRTELERGLPALRVTDDPVEIRRAERALAERIRLARARAKQGDIFTPNPGGRGIRINGTYPEREAVSTVPPDVLAALPSLPDDIEYRFTGRDLILFDTRASLIIDRVPAALRRPPRHP